MRIISGIYKNTPLKSPDSELTHPMGDREKLALFNMLSSYLPDATVLDCFAGTGALGLEALSRGAKSVVFLEKSPKIAKILSENLKITQKSPILTKIVISDIKNFHPDRKFSLILADPPYDTYSDSLIAPLPDFLAPEGILALSLPKSAPVPDFPNLTLLTSRTYAGAKIAIYTA